MNWLKYLVILGAICVTASNETVSIGGSPVKHQMQMVMPEINYPPNYLLIWAADWCPKCPRMEAIGDKLSKEGFDVFVVDFDVNRRMARKNKIAALPVAIVYTSSKEVKRITGISVQTEKRVEAQIREVLKKNKKEEIDNYDIY